MISASQLLYEHLGRPAVEGLEAVESLCWLCGGIISRGRRVEDWVGGNFTDHNRCAAPNSDHVCAACVFICSRTSPVPGRAAKEGKKFGANFRNVSHLLDADGYVNASKSEKPVILDWLRREHKGPWFATIADSGQLHMVPFAPLNAIGTKRGSVLFERQIVVLPRPYSVGWDMVTKMSDLLTAGATKEEIESGEYGPRTWQLCELRIRSFEDIWAGKKRGSPWFALAIWLAQRDEAIVAERMENGKAKRSTKRKAADPDRGAGAGAAPVVPADAGEEHPQALGHPDVPVPVGCDDHDEPRGVVHGDAARTEDRERQPVQLGLFG